MTTFDLELIHLAKEIYAQRLNRSGATDWDFRPHAKIAFDAARQFFAQLEVEFPQSEQDRSYDLATSADQLQQSVAPETPLPANPPA